MRFFSLTGGAAADRAALTSEYKTAHGFGSVRLGELHLFFRAGLRTYFIPYRDVHRCFRRVQLIPAGRKGSNDLRLQNLVICGAQGELAQVQLPGESAAKTLMTELQARIPEAEFGKPE